MLHFIVVSTTEALHRLPVNEIVYCTSHNSSTQFYLADKRMILASYPIAHYTSLLEQFGFIRIHQSTLLNISFLSAIYKKDNSNVALLTTGEKLTVARAKKTEVANALSAMSIEKMKGAKIPDSNS